MISVVTFKWKPRSSYRSTFGPEHVNTMRQMVARHYKDSHQFICVTDDPSGIEDGIRIIPLWNDHSDIPNPSFRGGPSCYRRLKVFSREIGSVLGERFVCIDLDMLITGDLRPLLNRTEDFIAWKNPDARWPYNGSLFMLTAGARPDVWESFDPATSPAKSHKADCKGSDQGWISYVLGKGEATWSKEDGVWSYQDEILGRKRMTMTEPLPPGARVVSFHGNIDPWDKEAMFTPWIRANYR